MIHVLMQRPKQQKAIEAWLLVDIGNLLKVCLCQVELRSLCRPDLKYHSPINNGLEERSHAQVE